MLKTFTLVARRETKETDRQGTISFDIIDENNDSRTVKGTTFLDENRVAQGISSENKRELPLIEGLFRLEINEEIEIEFDYYNEAYDRELDKTVNQIAYEKVMQMEKEKSLLYRIKQFFKGSSEAHLSESQ